MAFPIIMGQNIGTTITPILASIGASKNAKRAAAIHVSFNILGTIIFLIGCYTIQYTIGFPFWDQAIDKGGIANFHTIFNAVSYTHLDVYKRQPIGFSSLGVGQPMDNQPYRQSHKTVYLAHPFAVALGKIIIDGNNMHAFAGQSV